MIVRPPFLPWFPLLLFTGLLLLSYAFNLNGWWGTERLEYLRVSKSILDHWQGGESGVLVAGEYNRIYAFLGATLQYFSVAPNVALQVISWLSYSVSGLLMERLLSMLAQGSRSESRLSFVILVWVLAPVVVGTGLSVGGAALEMVTILAAFFYGLRWVEQERASDTIWMVLFTTLSAMMRPALVGLVLPLVLVSGWGLVARRKWRWLVAAVLSEAVLVTMVGCLHEQFMAPINASVLFQQWSPIHFFQRSFSTGNGVVGYLLPNVLFLFSLIIHPWYFLLLPGLLLLVKRTDFILPAKKTVLLCLSTYFMVLGGLPQQQVVALLPAYAMVLWLLFPAWDRLYCYGLYFVRKPTGLLLGFMLLMQLFFNIWVLFV